MVCTLARVTELIYRSEHMQSLSDLKREHDKDEAERVVAAATELREKMAALEEADKARAKVGFGPHVELLK